MEREETDFDETLSQYGAGYGLYLVLPIFGPSDLRKGASLNAIQIAEALVNRGLLQAKRKAA